MRLYLLPISTRRTLLYCQRLGETTKETTGWMAKATEKSARMWASWEKMEKGWQKMTVDYGNKALRRIPHEEWGLKSVPPLSDRRRTEELGGKEKVELIFPASLIGRESAPGVLRRLGTEREALHKRRLKWCFVGMPITAPVGILPLVPNLPFFYLVYRAWSHWRALKGGEHIQFLTSNKLLTLAPSALLDSVYGHASPEKPTLGAPGSTVPPPSRDVLGVNGGEQEGSSGAEKMLLTQKNGYRLAHGLDLPELEIELERAIWQVENEMRDKKGEEVIGVAGGDEDGKEKEGEKAAVSHLDQPSMEKKS